MAATIASEGIFRSHFTSFQKIHLSTTAIIELNKIHIQEQGRYNDFCAFVKKKLDDWSENAFSQQNYVLHHVLAIQSTQRYRLGKTAIESLHALFLETVSLSNNSEYHSVTSGSSESIDTGLCDCDDYQSHP